MKTFKQRLIDCSKQDWCAKIAVSGKTRHYRFIMPALQVANYINYDIPLKFRISLSKLKCSVHNLNVEVGRHNGIAYEQQLCILHDKMEIEDEFHFVMSCPVYQQLRNVFLPNTVIESTTINSLYSLFNSSEQEVLRLAKYIYNAFIIRENKLKEISGSAA